MFEINESTDHYLSTVYNIRENGCTVAVAYSLKDAEIVKEALEKARAEEAKHDGYSW